jgi:hypothetical protein
LASRTEHYGLTTNLAADDFIEPGHHNDLADLIDRVVGGVLVSLGPRGVHAGWELTSGAVVTPGCGLVAACWCETDQAQVISGLVGGTVNHVYAVAVAGSPTAGTVGFVAQLAPPGPWGAAYLGTLEVAPSGLITRVDNAPPGSQRCCHSIRFGAVSGAAVAPAVPASTAAELVVDHSGQGSFRIPGDLSVSSASAEFRWLVSAHHRGDQFALKVWNDGADVADFRCTWTREGLLR